MAAATVERYGDGGGTSPVEPIQGCLDDMAASLAGVVEVAAWMLTEEQLVDRIAAVLKVHAGLDELVARLVASALERDLARLAGATSASAWLAHSYRLSRRRAVELVAHAHTVDHRMEATRLAWAAGQLSTGQAVVKAEAELIGLAPRFHHYEFGYLAAHLVEVVNPDGAEAKLGARLEADENKAQHATVFQARRGVDGIGSFTGKLPNTQLDMLTCALEAIAAPRRRNAAGAGANVRAGVARGDGTGSVFDVDGDHTDPV